MADDQNIIIKIKKIKDNTAHGGAWKIAYADFVTAMMAFFLLLWLLSATEQETLEGLSNYFTPTLLTEVGESGSGGMFGGITSNEPGPTEDKIHTASLPQEVSINGNIISQSDKAGQKDENSTGNTGKIDGKAEDINLNTTKRLLGKAINDLPDELADLKQSILTDITDDGLRIQIIDQSNKGNFKHGSSELTERAEILIQFISQYISRLPNKISITGHTANDNESDDDWRLSIDRANSARRALLKWNISPVRIVSINGKSNTEPLYSKKPSLPQNRRMVVILLRTDIKKETSDKRIKPPSILK